MRRRLAAVAAVILTAAAGYLLSTTEGGSTTAQPRYVALGDSYSSGNGTFTGTGLCNRSRDAYPALLAAEAGWADWHHAACSGATTADVTTHQLSRLSTRTRLITITIGGNDLGFLYVLLNCVLYDTRGCGEAVQARREAMHDHMHRTLTTTYAAIRARAPHAALIVAGYPRLFDEPSTCGPTDTHPANQQLLNGFADDLNEAIRRAAAEAGARYVDVREQFTGHGVCSDVPYINGFAAEIPEAFHPTQAGHRDGYQAALRRALT